MKIQIKYNFYRYERCGNARFFISVREDSHWDKRSAGFDIYKGDIIYEWCPGNGEMS